MGGDQEAEEGSLGWVVVPGLGGLSRGLRRVSPRGQVIPAPQPGAAAGRGIPRSRPALSAQEEQPRRGTPTSTDVWG